MKFFCFIDETTHTRIKAALYARYALILAHVICACTCARAPTEKRDTRIWDYGARNAYAYSQLAHIQRPSGWSMYYFRLIRKGPKGETRSFVKMQDDQ